MSSCILCVDVLKVFFYSLEVVLGNEGNFLAPRFIAFFKMFLDSETINDSKNRIFMPA